MAAPVRRKAEAERIKAALRQTASPAKAEILARFFKTGRGDYGEGDRFLGVVVPDIRRIVKIHRDASRSALLQLLHSPWHEDRMTALLILVGQYIKGDRLRRDEIFELYLATTSRINNWDLVDLTAPHIVGAHLFGSDTSILTDLALSPSLWERRIAMLATHYFIRRGESAEALRIARLLAGDTHDLIHKAVGWMLREVGKHCSFEIECAFLDEYAAVMPRTMLRYAIERFPDKARMHYMKQGRGRTPSGPVSA